MNLYRIQCSQNCDANYPIMLPGWRCSACEKYGCPRDYGYASVDAAKVKPFLPASQWPMEFAEFCQLQEKITPLFPDYALVGPATQCGKPSVKILSKHKDMLFSASGIVVTEAGNEALGRLGIRGLVFTPVHGSFGKKKDISLFVTEFPACLDEALRFFEPGACSICKKQVRTTREYATIAAPSIRADADVMGYKSGAVSFIVVTERFRDAAMQLHGGNGLKFFPVPVFD